MTDTGTLIARARAIAAHKQLGRPASREYDCIATLRNLAAALEASTAALTAATEANERLRESLKHVIVVGYHEDCRRCIRARRALAAVTADEQGSGS